ncbi:hypothetical protein BB560_000163, partial [Smittium megazygosporum]
ESKSLMDPTVLNKLLGIKKTGNPNLVCKPFCGRQQSPVIYTASTDSIAQAQSNVQDVIYKEFGFSVRKNQALDENVAQERLFDITRSERCVLTHFSEQELQELFKISMEQLNFLISSSSIWFNTNSNKFCKKVETSSSIGNITRNTTNDIFRPTPNARKMALKVSSNKVRSCYVCSAFSLATYAMKASRAKRYKALSQKDSDSIAGLTP